MNILDPQFQYIPAVATDVSQTWKRFGFSPRANEARRAKLQSRVLRSPLRSNARSAVLLLCASVLAACAELPAPRAQVDPLPAVDYKARSPVFVHETDTTRAGE